MTLIVGGPRISRSFLKTLLPWFPLNLRNLSTHIDPMQGYDQHTNAQFPLLSPLPGWELALKDIIGGTLASSNMRRLSLLQPTDMVIL